MKFFRCENLGVVEASGPDVEFAFEALREAALDVLHGLFQRDLGRGCDDGVKVVRHDDEGVEVIAVLIAVVSKGFEKECGVGFYLEESAAVGGDSGDEICSELLRRRERHLGRIKEKPGAKALLFWGLAFRGLKAPSPPTRLSGE